jgi:hypothetical protein
MDTAIVCLNSLVRSCKDLDGLVIHDDGSLTNRERDRLQLLHKSVAFVDKQEADHSAQEALKNHPHCLHYRNHHPWALKLFDLCLVPEAPEWIFYTDADVLFLRQFRLPAPTTDIPIAVMKDSMSCFSLLPWHVSPFGPWKVTNAANTGVMLLRKSVLDIDFIESFLSNRALHGIIAKRPNWVEQTCWALLSARHASMIFDPTQVEIATKDMVMSAPNPVAIHFVSTFRHHLDRFAERATSFHESCTTLRIIPTGPSTAAGLLLNELHRKATFAGHVFRSITSPPRNQREHF